MATITVYPDPNPETSTVDGWVIKDDSSNWTTTRDATTGSATSDSGTESYVQSEFNTPNYPIRRVVLLFDTSAIPDGDTIDSAILSMYWDSAKARDTTNGDTVEVVVSNPASNTAVATGDFDRATKWTFTAQATNILISAFTGNAYNDFTLNATGRGNVSKTGISKFGLIGGNDLNNTTPTQRGYIPLDMAEIAGTGQDPKLVVNYSTPITARAGAVLAASFI